MKSDQGADEVSAMKLWAWTRSSPPLILQPHDKTQMLLREVIVDKPTSTKHYLAHYRIAHEAQNQGYDMRNACDLDR
jgi:hypothetical protein